MLDSARLKQILIINKTRNFLLLLSPDLVTTTGANSGISESVRSARAVMSLRLEMTPSEERDFFRRDLLTSV